MEEVMKLVALSRFTLALGIATTIALTSCSQLSRSTHQPYIQRAAEIADALGRTSGNQLAEYETCWDMGNECGYVIDFTTQDNATTIESRLITVGLSATVSAGAISSNFTTIGHLSSSPSIGSKLKEAGPNTIAVPRRHETYSWLLTEKDGRINSIVLYTIATWPNRYTFDGNPLVGDVVEVLVRYPQ